VFGLARLFGLRATAASKTALLLAAGEEFAFVIRHSAGKEGLVDHQIVRTILVSSTLSMFCTPPLASIGAAIGGSANAKAKAPVGKTPDRGTGTGTVRRP
jgi:CPA2 family monovalent cation:H+ antiporter-2